MPRYCIIDTETNGLPNFRLPADDPSQPYMASATFILTDENAIPLADHGISLLSANAEHSMVVYPDGWEMTPETTAINGLTTERCREIGIPITDVLEVYTEIVRAGYVVVAFNAQFDLKQFRAALRRNGMYDLFEETPNICAMRGAGKLGIEKAGPKKGGFPKLTDAYLHVTGMAMDSEHNALSDARACLAVFQRLLSLGIAPAPEVHFAKNGIGGAP